MIRFTNCLQDFLAFLLITFVLRFLFGSASCAPCSSATSSHFFMVMPCIFRSGAVSILTFTHAPQSYLAFEAINVSSQKPCILHTHYTQAYWTLDTLLYYYNSWYCAILYFPIWCNCNTIQNCHIIMQNNCNIIIHINAQAYCHVLAPA